MQLSTSRRATPRRSTIAASVLFTTAGIAHFARPDFFESIVPDWFSNRRLANRASGGAEIALGVGLLLAPTRRLSALGLVALVGIVFPANVDMAVNRVEVKAVDGTMTRSAGTASGPVNWIRLPLQAPLAWWMWREARAAA
jgi:uncharacterized membrane protein